MIKVSVIVCVMYYHIKVDINPYSFVVKRVEEKGDI